MAYKMLGVTDERDTCELCGKQHLKRCVVLENDTGGIVYYGTDCAARVLSPGSNDRVTGKRKTELDRAFDDVYKAKSSIEKYKAAGWAESDIDQRLYTLFGNYIRRSKDKTKLIVSANSSTFEVNL